MFKEHEKFWAFMALGFSVLAIAVMSVMFPTENEGTQRTLDAAMGAFTLALGVAANALFRIREPREAKVTIDQPANNPVPVEPQ